MDVRNLADVRRKLVDPALCAINAREKVLLAQRLRTVLLWQSRLLRLRILRCLRIVRVLMLEWRRIQLVL